MENDTEIKIIYLTLRKDQRGYVLSTDFIF